MAIVIGRISSRAKGCARATARRRGGDADEQYGAGAGAQAASGIPFARAKSGRPLRAGNCRKGWRIGAETLGHVILLDKTTTGDGIVAGATSFGGDGA